MLMLVASPDAVLRKGVPDPEIVQVLIGVANAGNPVGLISNHAQPTWFDKSFAGSKVQFLKTQGRQSGEVISHNAARFSLLPHDCLVLAAKREDIQMGKNGHAVLIAAGWSTDPQVKDLGIRVDSAGQLQEVVALSQAWKGQWWFEADSAHYRVRALADLSQYGKGLTQQSFSEKVTATVKNGGVRLNALLAVTSRSLIVDGVAARANLLWGVYPSSHSANDDSEVLSDFTHRLRTTVSRVRWCSRGEPLFIRHKPSSKRSMGGGGDRTDPTEQILTLHLNPFYAKSSRLHGRNVYLIDDCTTYGVSFGVAASFLRKAGVASVTGVALGKFGGQLRYYEIDINSDPFKPVAAAQFSLKKKEPFSGSGSSATQMALHTLIP